MYKYRNLKVVVAGQFGHGAEFKFGYPIVPVGDDPRNNWIKMDMVEKDPLDVRNYFPEIDEKIYKMRVSTYGTYYALVAPCKYDTSGRNGFYSITLFIPKGTQYTGTQVRSTLDALNVLLYDANNFDSSALPLVEQCLEQNGWEPEEQEPLIMPVKSVPAYKDAYREYETESELDKILQHAMQPEYTACRWIYLARTGLVPDSQLTKLTTRIRIKYDVEVPEEVKANKKTVVDGDILTVTYSKPNFDSHSMALKVGRPDTEQYLTYAENKVIVKTAAEAGVVFEKAVKIMLYDTEGKVVKETPRVMVNGEEVVGAVLKVKDSDLGTKLRIKISAGLYEDAEAELEADKLVRTPQMKVTLKPREGSVKLNITLGGKEFSYVETLRPADPLAQSLQRGTFNGYKVTRRQNSDEYDVDIASNRTVVAGKTEDKDESKPSPMITRIVALVVALVIGIAAGVMIERSLSSDGVEEVEEIAPEETALLDDTVTAPETAKPAETPEQAPAAPVQEEQQPAAPTPAKPAQTNSAKAITSYDALTADEKDDLAYLKKENKWSPSKVKSQRFKDMFTQLNNGNIDCLIPLFSNLDDKHVNGYVKIIVADIPKLTADEREKSKKYLKVNDKGNIATSWAAKKIGEMAKN